MIIEKTPLEGLFVIHPKLFPDQRGYFFESFNQKAFAESTGLNIEFIQDNEAGSIQGVLRGLHYQIPPFAQSKLVRVVTGEVLDVAVDIRPASQTYGKYFSLKLSGANKLQLFIPKGFAHGYLVLSEEAVFAYKCDAYYHSGSEAGIKFDDKKLNIEWGMDKKQLKISAKDLALPLFGKHQRFDHEIAGPAA